MVPVTKGHPVTPAVSPSISIDSQCLSMMEITLSVAYIDLITDKKQVFYLVNADCFSVCLGKNK